MRNADPVIDALERDFEFLRHVRGDRRPGERRGLRQRLAWLPDTTRWGLAIGPLLLGASLDHALYFSFSTERLGEGLRFLTWSDLGVAWITLVILRGRNLVAPQRRSELVQFGASVGVALAAVPVSLAVLPFAVSMALAVPILIVVEPTRSLDAGLGLGLLMATCSIAPVGILATCTHDAVRSLRRVRTAPLGWRDVGWVLLGIVPGAFLARIGLYFVSMFAFHS